MINTIILTWLMVNIDNEPIWIDMLLGISYLIYIASFVRGFVKGCAKNGYKKRDE